MGKDKNFNCSTTQFCKMPFITLDRVLVKVLSRTPILHTRESAIINREIGGMGKGIKEKSISYYKSTPLLLSEKHCTSLLPNHFNRNRIVMFFFFFWINKEWYIVQKIDYTGRIQERPQKAKQKEKGSKKRKRQTNQPTQKYHILGIAIEPKKEQSNKFDIRLWNKPTPCKQQSDNLEL